MELIISYRRHPRIEGFPAIEYNLIEIYRSFYPREYEPNELQNISLPEIDFRKGVILSGSRLPVWIICFLAHSYRQAQWIAYHDRELGEAIVMASKNRDFPPGSTIIPVLL